MSICSVAGCGRPEVARQMCHGHYKRWQVGDLRLDEPLAEHAPKGGRAQCSVDGCDRLAAARGWCAKHWKRWRAHGDPTKSLTTPGRAQCTISGCTNKVVTHGWCNKHRKRWLRHGDPTKLLDNPRASRTTPEDRFWSKVDKSGGSNACWLWTAYRDPQWGYGVFRMKAGENMWRAHRAAWVLTRGPIPEDALLCHICDNPPCVNPSHLYLGDNQTNSTDRVLRGRTTKGRPVHHGELSFHKLTLQQVREIRSRYAAGGISQSALGREYGVAQSTVGKIVVGKAWRHDH